MRKRTSASFVDPALCLTFANTAGWHASEMPTEWLTSYERLLEWGTDTGVLASDEAARLADKQRRRPREAAETLESAIELREAVFHTFSALASGNTVPVGDLAVLRRALGRALAHLTVSNDGDEFHYMWVATD